MNSHNPASDELSIEKTNSQGAGFAVSCRWQHDRFAHSVELIVDDRRIPVLSSCEGGSQDIWPSCPPLQQVHQQLIDEDPVLLAVGMAGSSHFSTSMLLRNGSNWSIELQVESACVVKPQTRVGEIHLGSQLQWRPEFELIETAEGSRLVHCDDQTPAVLITPADQSKCSQPLGSRKFEITPTSIQGSGTTQWQYRFSFPG